MLSDNGTSCAGTPDLTTTVTIPDSVQASIVLWWSPAGGLTASTYGDDPLCAPSGSALVVGRNVTTHVTDADFTAPSGYSLTNIGQTGSVMQEVAAGSAFGARLADGHGLVHRDRPHPHVHRGRRHPQHDLRLRR